ncbi:hypothetical protein KEU06_09310 [Pseudaminobacter sp. 19-2017]|uniref:Uncharacterized protein n=1 Tax=Pseudaminobacter soli (ex Zhang et al. 2022) TaxID=2831468 RepID=A0A942DXG3_9HYPH|nr:hypothetical protein [Pseudaminobacter soli]MBS3648802.1 hypothetical protein [Pseudaminobacter soli]
MTLTLKRPRPTFAQVFATTAHPDVLHWISKSEARIGPDAYKEFVGSLPSEHTQFLHLLEVSLRQGQGNLDGFRVASDLKSYLDWPVDSELVKIIDDAVDMTQRKNLRLATIAWVMETGTRFHAKPSEEVQYRGETFSGTRSGRVVEVDRVIASGTVADANDQRWTVLGENLVAA